MFLKVSPNVPTLVDGGVCGSVDSTTSYKTCVSSWTDFKDKN